MQRPLADEIRPKTLDEVVGQRHLLAPGAVLRRLIEGGTEANMVFYGPSGTGKTTIANLVAQQTHKTLYRLNATTASLQDVKAILAETDTLLTPGGVLLYLDEIQYFNKKQQQSLLEFMENGGLPCRSPGRRACPCRSPPPAGGTCARPSTPWNSSAAPPGPGTAVCFFPERTPPRSPSAAPCAMTKGATPCMTSPPPS